MLHVNQLLLKGMGLGHDGSILFDLDGE